MQSKQLGGRYSIIIQAEVDSDTADYIPPRIRTVFICVGLNGEPCKNPRTMH